MSLEHNQKINQTTMPKKNPQPKIKITQLSYVNLYSSNFEKLTEFYEKTLGLNAQKNNKNNWFGFNTGGTTFAIEPQSNRNNYTFKYNHNNPILLQFKINSIPQLTNITANLEKNGVTITQKLIKKNYGTFTTFLDPDNNVIELLVEPKTTASKQK